MIFDRIFGSFSNSFIKMATGETTSIRNANLITLLNIQLHKFNRDILITDCRGPYQLESTKKKKKNQLSLMQ